MDLNNKIMIEIDKKIESVKNGRQKLKNDITEATIIIKIREAELHAMESFIDILNDLKSKTK